MTSIETLQAELNGKNNTIKKLEDLIGEMYKEIELRDEMITIADELVNKTDGLYSDIEGLHKEKSDLLKMVKKMKSDNTSLFDIVAKQSNQIVLLKDEIKTNSRDPDTMNVNLDMYSILD